MDGIAAIVERRAPPQLYDRSVAYAYSRFDYHCSRLFSPSSLANDTRALLRLQRTIASLLFWSIEKLNGKAIFANTLGFAGKILGAQPHLLYKVKIAILTLENQLLHFGH